MKNSTPEERKRKVLFLLPLLILPLLALGFYALGGGKGDAAKEAALRGKGINTSLPGAQLKKEKDDKYSLYEKAQRDSGMGGSRRDAGAFSALGWDTAAFKKADHLGKLSGSSGGSTVGWKPASTDENEAKIKAKLAEIDKQVHTPVLPVRAAPDLSVSAHASELDKLEQLLKQKQEAGPPDPQLQQLNGMLDKIMQIQGSASAKGRDSIAAGKDKLRMVPDSAFRAVPAMVEGNQKVLQGGIVRLRLSDSLRLHGLLVPKGQLLFGSATITNQRLLLEIRNIRLGTAIIPVSLTVFSLDGLAGIDAPAAELGEAAGGGAVSALDNMEFLGMDPSIGTQAATAGIAAAKGLIGKKVRRVKVKLKGGYPVLLRNNQSGRP
jgi:hypothetical protein